MGSRQWKAAPAAAPAPDAVPPPVWSALPAVAALAVYLLQAPHVSGDKDASEFTLVLARNGVAHPSGYPLYTLFGHVFVKLVHALGASWSYAANSWSAVGGGVAIFYLHALAIRLVPADAPLGRRGRFLVALLPLILFGFNPMWTMETNLAEVYSWHVAWVCGTAFCFVGLARELASRRPLPARRLRRRAIVWGLLTGLGLAHHLTAALVALPLSICLALVAWSGRQLRTRDVLSGAFAACVPLLSYGIVAYRAFHPTLVQWPELGPSWSRVWQHLTGAQYHIFLGTFSPAPVQQRFLASYVYPFLFLGMVLLIIAAFRARGPSERPVLWTLAAAAAFTTLYAFDYGVFDPSSYFMAPMALGLAGLAPLAVNAGSSAAGVRRVARALLAGVALVALALLPAWFRLAVDRRQTYENFERLVHRMWESIPFDRGFVLWPDDSYARLHEYQWLRGEKPGIDVTNPWNIASDLPRTRFTQQYGFDPIAGVSLHLGADGRLVGGEAALDIFIEDLARNLNRHTALPVILFDPEKQSVRLLRKPGAAAADSAGGG